MTPVVARKKQIIFCASSKIINKFISIQIGPDTINRLNKNEKIKEIAISFLDVFKESILLLILL